MLRIARTVDHDMPATLARIITPSARVSDHHVLGDKHRHAGKRCDRGVGFVEFAGLGKRCNLKLVEPAVLVERLDQRMRNRGLLGGG